MSDVQGCIAALKISIRSSELADESKELVNEVLHEIRKDLEENRLNRSREIALEVLDSLKETEDSFLSDQKGEINWIIGNTLHRRGQPTDSFLYWTEAMRFFKLSGNHRSLSRMQVNCGVSMYSMSDYVTALNYYLQGYSTAKSKNLKDIQAYSLLNQAEILNDWGTRETALEKLGEAIHLFNDVGENRGLQHSYLIKGKIEMDRGNFTNALAAFHASLKISKEAGFSEVYGEINSCISSVELELGRDIDAENRCRETLDKMKNSDQAHERAMLLNSLAKSLMKQDRIDEALEAVEKSGNFLLTIEGQETLKMEHLLLNAKIFEKLGRYRDACEVMSKHINLKNQHDERQHTDEFTRLLVAAEARAILAEKDIVTSKNTELKMLNLQLEKALSQVKTLRGLLPICPSCKRIRDDKGYWTQIESYISDNSEAEFSHSLCSECLTKLYPDLSMDELR